MADGQDDFERIKEKIRTFFADMGPDLKLVGEVMAEAIVRTTLAGIGENDAPFAPYSPAYQEYIEAVGGKPQQTVSLRGLFYKAGQKRAKLGDKARLRLREGRQAFIGRSFVTRLRPRLGRGTVAKRARAGGLDFFQSIGAAAPRGVAKFTAKTGVTRPARGVTDKLSEMSLDLIKIEAADDSLRLIYTPRERDYMVTHQKGEGKMPRRVWFSFKKAAVMAAGIRVMTVILSARALNFNLSGAQAKSQGRQSVAESIRGRLGLGDVGKE
jgi:hypothetical protein